MRTFVVVAIAGLVACSSRAGSPTTPPASGAATPVDAAPVATGPSEAECETLFTHAIAIRFEEQRKTLPVDQLPTEDERLALRTRLRAELLPGCLAASRERHACGLAAKTLAELAACD